MALPALAPAVAAAAPAATTAAAPAATGLLEGIIANLVAGIATQGADKLLFQPGGQAIGPSSYATADPLGRSKYFTSTAEQLAVEQYLNNERFRRGLLSIIPGMGGMLPPMPTREDIVGGFVDGQFTGGAALREAQAQSLTAREIEKIKAERQFELQARLGRGSGPH